MTETKSVACKSRDEFVAWLESRGFDSGPWWHLHPAAEDLVVYVGDVVARAIVTTADGGRVELTSPAFTSFQAAKKAIHAALVERRCL